MRITKWHPYSDLANMYDRWNRIFGDDFFDESSKNGLTPTAWRPMTDIYESKDAYVFKIELPGFKKEDVKVEFAGDTLTLRGERKQEEETKNENCHRLERSYGIFERSFTIPKNVDAKKIDASLQDGILILTIPKIEEARTKAIPITVK
ncbi:MAG: Hsp20/alpha crystallin family protein [Candidatus Aminicenantes bacterium]|nr:Hsp20/alpha crystallin family protein [Acidobacteriota bacterium]MCG2812267.1 Hsp20/alpha crystallin family protein [Candidatus Aminicenantes bacterium]